MREGETDERRDRRGGQREREGERVRIGGWFEGH